MGAKVGDSYYKEYKATGKGSKPNLLEIVITQHSR